MSSQSLYSAKMGVRAQQLRLDTIGNNLANINTVGHKGVRIDFKDALYQTLRRPVQPQNELNLELGHGVLVGATMRSFQQGSVQVTENLTDFMLDGDGFFSVVSPAGETQYTRNGAFKLSQEDDGIYMVNGSGCYVLDQAGQKIKIPGNPNELSVTKDGQLFLGEESEPFARLGVHSFDNTGGLKSVGASNFIPTDASGEPKAMANEDVLVRQGALEMSNVELANEMSRLIRTQRAMQLSSRAITTADQMMGIANSIRR